MYKKNLLKTKACYSSYLFFFCISFTQSHLCQTQTLTHRQVIHSHTLLASLYLLQQGPMRLDQQSPSKRISSVYMHVGETSQSPYTGHSTLLDLATLSHNILV